MERQVIERVDRTLWTDGDLRPASTGQYYGAGGGALPPPSLMDIGLEEPGSGRERLYDPNDWLRRGGSTRTSKYRQRMERARKEFLAGTGPQPPPSQMEFGEWNEAMKVQCRKSLPLSFIVKTYSFPSPFAADPVTERFRKSTDDLLSRQQRQQPSLPARSVEYRGPLLQKFHSGEFAGPDGAGGGGQFTPSGLGQSPYEQVRGEQNQRKSRGWIHRRAGGQLEYHSISIIHPLAF